MDNIRTSGDGSQKPVTPWKHPSASRDYLFQVANRMAFGNDKPRETATPSASTVSINETSRARSIATRLSDAEFGEVEAAAAAAGKKVAEWLREAALAHARASAGAAEQTDPILLAEVMGMRSLMLNLFARASEGPLTTDDLRKMSAYSDSIKEQKAQDYMAQRHRRNSPKTTDKS
ncbi:hypothetical protein BH10ACI4_BH10ACI4_11540 [soil metagenome]